MPVYATRIPKSKSKPSPVRATVVIFDASRPTRTTGFGWGILAYRPHHRAPASFEDLAWAAEAFGHGPERVWDRETIDESRALEFETMERIERGLLF